MLAVVTAATIPRVALAAAPGDRAAEPRLVARAVLPADTFCGRAALGVGDRARTDQRPYAPVPARCRVLGPDRQRPSRGVPWPTTATAPRPARPTSCCGPTGSGRAGSEQAAGQAQSRCSAVRSAIRTIQVFGDRQPGNRRAIAHRGDFDLIDPAGARRHLWVGLTVLAVPAALLGRRVLLEAPVPFPGAQAADNHGGGQDEVPLPKQPGRSSACGRRRSGVRRQPAPQPRHRRHGPVRRRPHPPPSWRAPWSPAPMQNRRGAAALPGLTERWFQGLDDDYFMPPTFLDDLTGRRVLVYVDDVLQGDEGGHQADLRAGDRPPPWPRDPQDLPGRPAAHRQPAP